MGRTRRTPAPHRNEMRKRRSTASLGSSTVDRMCSETDPLFRKGPDRSVPIGVHPCRPVWILDGDAVVEPAVSRVVRASDAGRMLDPYEKLGSHSPSGDLAMFAVTPTGASPGTHRAK